MANLRQAKVAIKNAQALELFMRIVPDAAAFLDCFSFSGTSRFDTVLRYDAAPNAESVEQAPGCYDHLQKLAQHLKAGATEDTAEEKEPMRLEEGASLHASLALGDSRLKYKILDLSARLINEQLEKNPGYMLSCEHAPELKEILGQGFDRKVSVSRLERLLPHMSMLETAFREAKLPQRYR